MDSVIVLTHGENKLIIEVGDYSSGSDLLAALVDAFPGSKLDNVEFTDFADFPDSIFYQPKAELCNDLHNYNKAVQELSSSSEDAFKAFYEEEGGNPLTLLTEFNNRYTGEFNDTYDFGKDMAEAFGIQLLGNESFFDFEGFGESAASDYEVLEDRYYFRR